MMNGMEKSDSAIVAVKSANKGASAPAEPTEPRAEPKGNPEGQSTRRTQDRESVSQAADRIRQFVQRERKVRLTTLLHHVTVDTLRWAFFELKKNAAAGADGMTWRMYEKGLEGRLADLHDRVHSGAYRATPSRRVNIPKPDGGTRPLGVAAIEDKIVQKVVAEIILTPIYEAEFLGFSYGFRPGRGAHNALDALVVGIDKFKINWVVDCDIRKFFDTVSRDWLVRFLEHRIGDKRVIRLIVKWLNAGVMEDGEWRDDLRGTPQGSVMTPRTQKATSALSGRSWDGGTVLWLICAVNGNTLMANGSLHTSPKGRATQRRLHTARPGRDGERSRDASVAALWVVAASVVSLCPGRARHGPGGRTRRSADPNHHQDSGHAGGDVARICQEQRRVHRRDRRASSETLVLADRSSWLNIGQAFAPPFTSITPSTACSTPSFRTPTPSWCPIGPTLSRPGRTT